MRRKTTKTDEPSKASLEEMPEVDFSRVGKVTRGKYAARARRSLEVLVIDKKVSRTLGGPDAIRAILTALARAVEDTKKRRRAA